MTHREIKRQLFNAASARGHLPEVVDSAEANGIRDTGTLLRVLQGSAWDQAPLDTPGMRVTSRSSVGLAEVHTVSVSEEEAEQLGVGPDLIHASIPEKGWDPLLFLTEAHTGGEREGEKKGIH